MLQDDAKTQAGAFHRCNRQACAFDGNVERLFDQNMFAGGGAAADEIEMGERRGQQQDGIDGGVGKRGVKVGDDAQVRMRRRESRATLGAWRKAGGDFHARAKIAQGGEVRLQRHAEPDNGDASFFVHLFPFHLRHCEGAKRRSNPD